MPVTIAVFIVATAAVVGVGPRLARIAEALANRYRISHVLVGAILLGVVTSLPGLALTVTAAARGDVELALANAVGGVAAQTFFLAIADIVVRRGTLSSRAPTREVGFQAAILMLLLALLVIGLGTPHVSVGRVHPASAALVAAYMGGLALSRRIDGELAAARPGGDDIEGGHAGQRGKIGELEDAPSVREESERSSRSLWLGFGASAVVLVAAGYALGWSGSRIAESGLVSSAGVGVALTAVATSTPELVTALAAARRGAIGLAAGDIIGGNTFDTLFVSAADAVSPTSIFATAGGGPAVGLVGWALVLNAVLIAGLVRRGRGTAAVDVESLAIAAIWVVGVAVMLFG